MDITIKRYGHFKLMSLAVSNHLRLFNWTNTLSILILEYGRQFSQDIDIFVSISPETTTSGDHNFWWWGPFSMISSPIESWDWGLSIGEEIVENGHHHQKLWRFWRFVVNFAFKSGPKICQYSNPILILMRATIIWTHQMIVGKAESHGFSTCIIRGSSYRRSKLVVSAGRWCRLQR